MVTSTSASKTVQTAPAATGSTAAGSLRSASFDQQLSQALSESLQRLGVAPGEINISLRNGGSLSSRQIVITYSALDTAGASAPSTSAAGTAAEGGSQPLRANPFTMDPSNPLTALPAAVPAVEVNETGWSLWTGPRDKRDGIAAGGGKVTASGAPEIKLNATPVANQYNYAGPGAMNPYFTNPGNPLRSGYVLGFDNWFEDTMILGGKNGPAPANRSYYATEEGAKEALRLVRQYAPEAELVQQTWGGGPFVSSRPMYMIRVGEGKLLNAGGILTGYYYGGSGVTAMSDVELERSVLSA